MGTSISICPNHDRTRARENTAYLIAALVGLSSLAIAVTNPATAPSPSPERAAPPLRQPAALAAEPAPVRALRDPVTTAALVHVVLIAIDGVPARDVLGTARDPSMPWMPELADMLSTHGAAIGRPGSGADVRASGPNYLSLPGYTEMLTGRPSSTCADNACPQTTTPTIVDEIAARFGGESTAVVGSWQLLRRAASRAPDTLFVSCGPDGAPSHELLANTEYRPDAVTAPLALRTLESRAPRFMFIGLGDTDELAHLGDRPGFVRALTAADTVIGRVRRIVDAFEERGEPSALFITSDHGRALSFRGHGAAFPESGATWIAAYGAHVRAAGVVAPSAPRRLADLTPTIRRLLSLPDDTGAGAGAPLEELVELAPTADTRRAGL